MDRPRLEDHIGVIKHTVNKHLPFGMEFDDAYQEACMVFEEALAKYDPSQSSFIGYLKRLIKWRLWQLSRSNDVVRLPKGKKYDRLFYQVPKVVTELRYFGEPVNDGVIAEALSCPVEAVAEYRSGKYPRRLDEPVTGSEELTGHDLHASPDDPEENAAQLELAEKFREFESELDCIGKDVFRFRFLDPQHWSVVGDLHGITKQAVNLREKALKERFRKWAIKQKLV